MEVLYARCCGIDVHQRSVVACLSLIEEGLRRKEVRSFGTTTRELISMRNWLIEAGCTHVAMESTGVYWRPMYQRLFGFFELVVANAQHLKAVPGRKTDVKDAEWLADLLQHGLLSPSFVPPQDQQELRQLTRLRLSLTRGVEPIRQPYPQAVAGRGNQAHLRPQRRDGGFRTSHFRGARQWRK